jgi:hypothetical protein
MDDDRGVVSNPYAALAVNNAKYVKNSTELHLSGKNIGKIANFGSFVNLEVLWLNGNKLTKLDGLGANIRIKELYLHDNRMSNLRGGLDSFTFLETLTLFNNQLQDLHSNLDVLRLRRHLRHLDLFGNPLAEVRMSILVLVLRVQTQPPMLATTTTTTTKKTRGVNQSITHSTTTSPTTRMKHNNTTHFHRKPTIGYTSFVNFLGWRCWTVTTLRQRSARRPLGCASCSSPWPWPPVRPTLPATTAPRRSRKRIQVQRSRRSSGVGACR